MPIKVRVQNCQSIKDASIEIDGLTVLTGANNSGKTAYMRALRAPFINAPVGALVRHGETSMIVEVEFDDGQTLRWEKGPKVKPEYTINGGEPFNPGREVPKELEDLGVMPIIIGKDKLWPQMATQFPSGQFSGPIFLLDRPGSLMAEVVADVERVGRLSQAMKLSKSDAKKATDKLKVRRGDHEEITKELATFDGLDDAVSKAAAVEGLLDEAAGVAVEYKALAALETRYQARSQEVTDLAGIEAVSVPGTESVEEAKGLAIEVEALTALSDRWAEATGTVEVLSGIESVSIPDTAAIDEALGLAVEATALGTLSDRWTEAGNAVEHLAGVESIDLGVDTSVEEAAKLGTDLVALGTLSDRWAEATDAEQRWSKAHAVAEGLSLDDDPRIAQAEKLQRGLTVLSDLLIRLGKRQAEVDTLAGDLADAESEESEATDAVVLVLGESEACPTCHTPMGETHLHGEVT